jgi:protein-tyrosine kinase
MSIVDALERAKKLGRERAEAGAKPARRVVTVPPAGAAQTPMASAATDEVPVRPQLRRVEYHVGACQQNRILVPETDKELMHQGASSYRMLRTRILQRCRANEWTTLAVTSPGPGEGKSLTSLNLALSIAREGNQDVFLLDCDMRNPSVCRYLGTTPEFEIAKYFEGECSAQDVLFNIGIDRLALAGNVHGTDTASELLSTGRFNEFIAAIRGMSAAPVIIVDLPPLLNTDDALVVAPSVDALVLVVGEGTTRREGLEKAAELLSEFNVAGVVLNRSLETVGSEYYGSAY